MSLGDLIRSSCRSRFKFSHQFRQSGFQNRSQVSLACTRTINSSINQLQKVSVKISTKIICLHGLVVQFHKRVFNDIIHQSSHGVSLTWLHGLKILKVLDLPITKKTSKNHCLNTGNAVNKPCWLGLVENLRIDHCSRWSNASSHQKLNSFSLLLRRNWLKDFLAASSNVIIRLNHTTNELLNVHQFSHPLLNQLAVHIAQLIVRLSKLRGCRKENRARNSIKIQQSKPSGLNRIVTNDFALHLWVSAAVLIVTKSQP